MPLINNRSEIIIRNFDSVADRVKSACDRAGRDLSLVNILAVTKYAATQDILTLLQNGKIKHIGENRVQDAVSRWQNTNLTKYNVIRHFIGHLQTNKVNKAVEFSDYINSVDSFKLASMLDMSAKNFGKKLKVMIQIKLTGKENQSGVSISETQKLLDYITKLNNLIPCGYMGIAPICNNPQDLRPLFKQVKAMFDTDFSNNKNCWLSLGMTNDFEIAVEEGSTLPRIGSAIFSAES